MDGFNLQTFNFPKVERAENRADLEEFVDQLDAGIAPDSLDLKGGSLRQANLTAVRAADVEFIHILLDLQHFGSGFHRNLGEIPSFHLQVTTDLADEAVWSQAGIKNLTVHI